MPQAFKSHQIWSHWWLVTLFLEEKFSENPVFNLINFTRFGGRNILIRLESDILIETFPLRVNFVIFDSTVKLVKFHSTWLSIFYRHQHLSVNIEIDTSSLTRLPCEGPFKTRWGRRLCYLNFVTFPSILNCTCRPNTAVANWHRLNEP